MRKNELVALILNIVVAGCGIAGLIFSINEAGSELFVPYTIDSGILCTISSLIFVVSFLFKQSIKQCPKFVMVLRYMGTCCTCLTFLIVIFVLAPMIGFSKGTFMGHEVTGILDAYRALMFDGHMLFYHLLVPVLSFISFVWFESDRRLNRKSTIYFGVTPTLIYAIVLVVLNILKVVEGPYPFLKVYEQPIWASILWFIGILVFDYLKDKYILYFNQKHSAKRTFKKN